MCNRTLYIYLQISMRIHSNEQHKRRAESGEKNQLSATIRLYFSESITRWLQNLIQDYHKICRTVVSNRIAWETTP